MILSRHDYGLRPAVFGLSCRILGACDPLLIFGASIGTLDVAMNDSRSRWKSAVAAR